MRLRFLLIPLGAAIIAGCVAEHRLMRPAPDARFPELAGDADAYPAHRAAWTREAPIGIRGTVSAVLLDPALGADQLAQLARAQGQGLSRDGYFETLWAALYGPDGDRLPIDVQIALDRLFYSPATLARDRWDFRLEDDTGRSWRPHHVAVLPPSASEPGPRAAGSAPHAVTYRLWFLQRPAGERPLIDGRTRDLVLHVRGTPGAVSLRWKFKPASPR